MQFDAENTNKPGFQFQHFLQKIWIYDFAKTAGNELNS
jgi:hypothetical protein